MSVQGALLWAVMLVDVRLIAWLGAGGAPPPRVFSCVPSGILSGRELAHRRLVGRTVRAPFRSANPSADNATTPRLTRGRGAQIARARHRLIRRPGKSRPLYLAPGTCHLSHAAWLCRDL